jgi:competence protein ComEC
MKVYSVLVILTTFFLGAWQLRWSSDSSLSIHILDVGQGDSILVEVPGGKTILIDGGPGDYVLPRLGEELPPWIRTIDIVVLTHPHADHIEGLLDVMERYRVQEVIFNPVCYENSSYEYFLGELDSSHIRVQFLDDFGYIVETFGGVRVGFFTDYWDRCGVRGLSGVSYEGVCGECRLSLNDTSVVTAVSYGGSMVLLMGDAEKEVETGMAVDAFRVMGYPDTVILKAGHHCSRTASDAAFLDRVKPVVAICSLGEDNSFGHPHTETIERFEQRGIRYLRTDEEGTVTVTLQRDGWEYE